MPFSPSRSHVNLIYVNIFLKMTDLDLRHTDLHNVIGTVIVENCWSMIISYLDLLYEKLISNKNTKLILSLKKIIKLFLKSIIFKDLEIQEIYMDR